MKIASAILVVLVLAGCTNINVQPMHEKPELVCIQKNEKVIVKDFLPAMMHEFQVRGIDTYVYEGSLVPDDCNYIVKYTARRAWDMTMFMHTADIFISNSKGELLAKAHYDCGSGFNMNKYEATETKVNKMMQELFPMPN